MSKTVTWERGFQPLAGSSGGETVDRGPSRFSGYLSRPLASLAPFLFVLFLVALGYAGWRFNEEGHLTPEKGVGYWLGIAGSLAMLLLLLYPLRKKFMRIRWLGKPAWWFRIHMMLGLLGPTLILIHCNFKPGSLNGSVALTAMLLVAGSGLVGRYIYGRVHMGLYGRKARLEELLADSEALPRVLGAELPAKLDVMARLRAHADRSMNSSVPSRLLLQRPRSSRIRRALMADIASALRAEAAGRGWGWREQRRRRRELGKALDLCLAATDRAATFGIYDSLLSAWHVAHLPLFLLLIMAAIVHVVAVHLF